MASFLDLLRLLGYSLLAIFSYTLFVACRRLYFHPLSHIPGPKLAGATWLYQTYFSFAPGGAQYYLQIAKLHGIYGMFR